MIRRGVRSRLAAVEDRIKEEFYASYWQDAVRTVAPYFYAGFCMQCQSWHSFVTETRGSTSRFFLLTFEWSKSLVIDLDQTQ